MKTPESPDRGRLTTEQRLSASRDLDMLSVRQTLELINDQDAQIAGVIRQAIPDITRLVEALVPALRADGRLIYLGAGTSGRLGVLDAAEIPPTFHCLPGAIIGIIAGGDSALRQSSEGKEDDPDGARQELAALNVGAHDTVLGIAAGGTTPYVLGGLAYAKSRRCRTALITCVPAATIRCEIPNATCAIDHFISLPVGPEVLTGSTRMKAGTATKLVLNMISTTALVQLGKTWGNLMVDLRATNAKLRDRAARILIQQLDISRPDAFVLLDRAAGKVKLALVMHRKDVDAAAAQHLLDQHHGQLRLILGAPQ